jgi:hypothetical protein
MLLDNAEIKSVHFPRSSPLAWPDEEAFPPNVQTLGTRLAVQLVC